MRAKRTDYNQTDIVNLFRRLGCGVHITSMVGNGYADICVGLAGNNYLFEIKDGSKPPSKRLLTPAEKKFHDTWPGQIDIIESMDEVLEWMSSKCS